MGTPGQYGPPPRPPQTWLDSQFANTNILILVLFSCCCGIIALIPGIIVLASSQDPIAKKNATIVVAVSAVLLVLGAIAQTTGAIAGFGNK